MRPIGIHGMSVTETMTAGEVYANPSAVIVRANTVEIGIYEALWLYSGWANGVWSAWDTGWYRVRIWK